MSDHTHVRPWRHIERRKSRQIRVGSVLVGGDAPISVQSMTNTPTTDAAATIDQIRQLEEAGADIVRVSCPDVESTAAFRTIVREAKVPLVADIHFHYKRGIEAAEAGAACLRINPGNIGSADRVRDVIQAAKDNGCSMRIGVNAGSLEKELLEKYGEPCPDAMVESALNHARILQDHDFHEFKISVKASDPFLTVAAYQQLAEAIDCPLHLGVTEAGPLRTGTIKSAIGLGSMLWAGIGAYAVEFFVWLEALSRAPLSLLFPAAALAYCGVVLAGKVVLGEVVSRRRWLGTLVITLGVMLVAIAGSQA